MSTLFLTFQAHAALETLVWLCLISKVTTPQKGLTMYDTPLPFHF